MPSALTPRGALTMPCDGGVTVTRSYCTMCAVIVWSTFHTDGSNTQVEVPEQPSDQPVNPQRNVSKISAPTLSGEGALLSLGRNASNGIVQGLSGFSEQIACSPWKDVSICVTQA